MKIKQKRDKQGKYQRKHKETIKHLILFCVVVWTVNLIDLHTLASERVTWNISNPNRSWDVRDTIVDGSRILDSEEPIRSNGVLVKIPKTEEGEGNTTIIAPPSAVERLIRETFPEDSETAVAVAKAESGMNPNAKGDIALEYKYEGRVIGHSCGVFQVRVLPGRPDCETLKDPKTNIEYARKLYDRSGWMAWSAYLNGAYKKFL